MSARKRFFKEKYGSTDPYDCKDSQEKPIRMQYYQECMEKATTYPNFDVVLTVSAYARITAKLGEKGERFAGQEMPLGAIIALLAIHAGVKNVAVVTDMGHHDHRAFDALVLFLRDQQGKGHSLDLHQRLQPCVVG